LPIRGRPNGSASTGKAGKAGFDISRGSSKSTREGKRRGVEHPLPKRKKREENIAEQQERKRKSVKRTRCTKSKKKDLSTPRGGGGKERCEKKMFNMGRAEREHLLCRERDVSWLSFKDDDLREGTGDSV